MGTRYTTWYRNSKEFLMDNFDKLINEFYNNPEYVLEHCKRGEFFVPYNILQIKILSVMYNKYLRGKTQPPINNLDDIINLFVERMPSIFEVLGDKLCYTIPNYKTKNYTEEDLNRWAKQLISMINYREFYNEDV